MHTSSTVYDVVIASCAAILLASYTDGQQMPCDIPSVPFGQTTILTCHYDKSILESKQKILVLHYCENLDTNPETILFNSFFDGKMEFYTHPDYVLHNSTSTIQVMIPRVTEKYVGRYVCLTLQSDNIEECKFILSGNKVTNYDIVSSTTADLQDTSTIQVRNINDDYLWIIIGIVGALTIVIIATVIFCFILPHLRSKSERDAEQGKADKNPHNGAGEDLNGNVTIKTPLTDTETQYAKLTPHYNITS